MILLFRYEFVASQVHGPRDFSRTLTQADLYDNTVICTYMFEVYHVEIFSELNKRSEGKTMIRYSVSARQFALSKKKNKKSF